MKRSGIVARPIILVLLGVGVVGFLVTFAGYAGDLRYLEMTGDYRPYQLGIGVVCLAAALAARRFNVWPRILTTVALCAVVSATVNAIEVLPVLLASQPKPDSSHDGVQLKALAFNVEASNTRFAATREWVVSESPDIAMFCEAHGRWRDELLPLEQKMPHHVRVDAMDIEVFSRHPMIRTQVFHFGPERGFVAVGLKIEGIELTFIAIHTYPRQWRGAEGFRLRTRTLEEGLGEAPASLARPLLVMGDFNASPWSPAYKAMTKKSGLQSARDGFGLVMTHHGHDAPSRWLWRPIDHCLYSDGVEIKRFSIGPDLTSDHLPILVECVLPHVTTQVN